MKKSRLYIAEGLPCSGKSSTARYISEITGGVFFDENCGCHPADYEFSAFIPDNAPEFTPQEREQFKKNAEPADGGMIIPLNTVLAPTFDKALQYKIYDFLDWDTERRLMLDKWRSFAESALSDEKIYVFNCVLLQNPMCETMMRFGQTPEQSLEYISEICRIIKPLSPVVVYLNNTHIADSIKAALPERGEEWLNSVVDYHCGGAYGRQQGLSGFEGYVSALEERQRRELSFLPKLPVKSIILTDPQQDWNAALNSVANALKTEE